MLILLKNVNIDLLTYTDASKKISKRKCSVKYIFHFIDISNFKFKIFMPFHLDAQN